MDTIDELARLEIGRRKTFAIISHPDAGKTTVTEKLLLFGNAIQMAGTVKAKRSEQFATSDWMEIEKQRGISVTSSVMQFSYDDHEINLLDTPGHADFSEDTYRVLTAVDSALMVIDSAKGIETQTKKLFQVCRDRHMPIMTLMNKMDREGRDPFELLGEIETQLHLSCAVMTWPIGQGSDFKGVYDLMNKCVRLIRPNIKELRQDAEERLIENLDDPRLLEAIGERLLAKLKEDLELVQGAGQEFKRDDYLAGKLSPVFFSSAIKNFGIREILDSFISYAPAPLQRPAETRVVDAFEPNFTGLIFKIQANMDPKHRDRVAFLRICSGEFVQGMGVYHVRSGREFKIKNALQFMSQKRSNVDRAYAGDIIGIHDRGSLMIGDAITTGEKLKFTGIPQFSPDLFSQVTLKNPIKIKQLQKGLEQLAEEGSSQLFFRKHNSDKIIGVVGQLQFEVVKFRLLHEYGADANFYPMPYTYSRWYRSSDRKKQTAFESYYHDHIVYDVRDYPMMLFKSEWELNYIQGKHPDMIFYSSLINYEKGGQQGIFLP
ncbi:MAG: peptide chain release factor 3 [Deltaproteobacteria bacterium CG11_big_fil_rev_8_21_14_0_20_49_13]|nr:MAG: peptide chain release factor 3 [Deltaproteobacteria bacterium CG11_big_fil_rev_8_21_14_0_20_49_13]